MDEEKQTKIIYAIALVIMIVLGVALEVIEST
jgi:hypothetical protein